MWKKCTHFIADLSVCITVLVSEGKSWKWTHTLAHQTKNCLVLWIIGLYTLKIIDFYSKTMQFLSPYVFEYIYKMKGIV